MKRTLIGQTISYIANRFLLEPIFLDIQQSTLYNSPIITIQIHWNLSIVFPNIRDIVLMSHPP